MAWCKKHARDNRDMKRCMSQANFEIGQLKGDLQGAKDDYNMENGGKS